MASKFNCENCNAAPAAWFCTADGAYLCARCDISIHSANKLAMRHERIPIEAKMAKDAAKCRPCTPAYDNAIMGIPQRTGTEQQQGVGNTPSTSAATTPAAVAGGDGDVNGSNGSEMDWLVMGGGLDDPLTSLLNMEQENQASGGGGGFTLSDDLFSMPAADPSGMFTGGGSQLRPTALGELKAATPAPNAASAGAGAERLAMDLGSIGENQVKQESAASGASDSMQVGANGGVVMVGGHQQQQQQQMGVLGGGPQGEVEAVLTRPFAASALRHAQLQRYRAKRLARHLGHKKIRYECRKTLADNRPRIKGRFAKVHVGGAEDGANANALTTAQSCPDLTALARLNSESIDGSEDSSNKKSRLGNASNAVNSAAAGGGGGGAAANNGKNAAAPGSGSFGGNGGGLGLGRGLQFGKGEGGEQMADNTLLGEIGELGYDGGGGLGLLRGGAGRVGMPYTQSEVSLVALDRVVW